MQCECRAGNHRTANRSAGDVDRSSPASKHRLHRMPGRKNRGACWSGPHGRAGRSRQGDGAMAEGPSARALDSGRSSRRLSGRRGPGQPGHTLRCVVRSVRSVRYASPDKPTRQRGTRVIARHPGQPDRLHREALISCPKVGGFGLSDCHLPPRVPRSPERDQPAHRHGPVPTRRARGRGDDGVPIGERQKICATPGAARRLSAAKLQEDLTGNPDPTPHGLRCEQWHSRGGELARP